MAGTRILPFMVHDPIAELDYPESIPRLEEALEALQRGEWPDVRTPDGRHPV